MMSYDCDNSTEMLTALNEVNGIFVADLLHQSKFIPDRIRNIIQEDNSSLIYLTSGPPMKPTFYCGLSDKIIATNVKSNVEYHVTIEQLLNLVTKDKSFFNQDMRFDYTNGHTGGFRSTYFLAYYRELLNNSTYSFNAVCFIKEVILNALYVTCRQNKHNYNNVYKYIKQNYTHIFETENLGDDLYSIFDSMMKFIGKDTKYLYFHKTIGFSLIIEKSVDYRVYEYYKLLDEINKTRVRYD